MCFFQAIPFKATYKHLTLFALKHGHEIYLHNQETVQKMTHNTSMMTKAHLYNYISDFFADVAS